MAEKVSPVVLDDLVAASASGVLRALDARKIGLERISAVDLIKSGFIVDIHIIAGGFPGPWLDRVLSGRGGVGMLQAPGQE